VAACAALALLLFFGLTQNATQISVLYCDGGTAVTKGPASPVLVATHSSIGDSFCTQLGPVKPRHRLVRAADVTEGYFPRGNVPWLLALVAGIVAPGLLLYTSFMTVLGAASDRIRSVIAIGFWIPAGLIFLMLTMELIQGAKLASLWDVVGESAFIGLSLVAVVLFGTGAWLWRRRSAKEPA